MTRIAEAHPASFRDPSGFVYEEEGALYRQVNCAYRPHWDHLMQSGLYEALVAERLLIPHEEVPVPRNRTDIYRILRPERIPLLSYPYEWCFGQLRDAALLTLRIQQVALAHGMCLKDASAYNVQFHHGKPIFLDTLSFEKRVVGQPWIAYRQFCQHFLAPLALMCTVDVRLGCLLGNYLDGIPLDFASRLLPYRTRLRFSLLTHIHLHAVGQRRLSARSNRAVNARMSDTAFRGLLDSLETAIRGLRWTPPASAWSDYYAHTNYSAAAFAHKKEIITQWIERVQPRTVRDIGSNDGTFSRLASERGIPTLACDLDPAAVEKNYRHCVENGEANLLPLLIDITNPTPARGWANTERDSFADRAPGEMLFALALVHHLALTHNLPFKRIAAYFRTLCRVLVIEFVPLSDSQAQSLICGREWQFDTYDRIRFEQSFAADFQMEAREPIRDSDRVLYLFRRREENA